MFFKRKKKPQIKNIDSLANKIEVLLSMAETDAVKDKLAELHDVAKFAYPSQSEDIVDVEKKISSRLEDLKIKIATKKKEELILDDIKDLNTLYIERKAMV